MSLEDYDISKVIGRGTYGEVHLVTHKKDKKQYVIKKLALVNASGKERKAAEQEAKLLSDLRHPNIVSYKDSFESTTGHLYIVMGFAEGGDLYTKLKEHRERNDYLSEQQTVRWYIQICMALQYLHGKRILHRDLKTQNIFLTKTQIIKVGDLGIAKVLENATDMATTLIGTPYYMSPELFSNRPYNQKSDVWALGCCMYEMVTLKHAFNAKDINSLVYKILKGKMPPMPKKYPTPLCDLIKDMLNQSPEKRPSVTRILRNPYIKKHIQLFLDESNKKRRPGSERTSRKSSAASSEVNSRPTSARKTSTNSQGSSSPSPHPPSSAPDPTKPPRITRARSPNITPSSEPVKVESHEKGVRISSKDVKIIPKKTPSPKLVEDIKRRSPKPNKNPDTSDRHVKQANPPKISQNQNGNNAKPVFHEEIKNSERLYDFADDPLVEEVETHQKPEPLNGIHKSPIPPARRKKQLRTESASSSCSSSSQTSTSSTRKNRRPLPECPRISPSFEPERKEKHSSEDKLRDSGESMASVASSVASTASKTKSARERRRERHEKQKPKTPAIVEEIRKSRSTGFKKPLKEVKDESNTKKDKIRNDVFLDIPDSASGDAPLRPTRPLEKGQGLTASELQQQQPEIEEFVTLLHTTLHLGSDRELAVSEDGDFLEEAERRGDLSPVPELSESSSSSTNQVQSFGKNTPAATPISVPQPPSANRLYSDAKQGISKGTLRSTQRLMDRIVSLRKECIKGLGVSLLHRAYEVLDANEDEDTLQDELVALLGQVRYDQWAGKIWQLKYCEESMFGHCGTITAY